MSDMELFPILAMEKWLNSWLGWAKAYLKTTNVAIDEVKHRGRFCTAFAT
jgi:hypothetical protein